MKTIRYESKDYKTYLLNLGIPPDIIPDTIDYSPTYKALWQAMHFFTPKLIINEAWQLLFFYSSNDSLEILLEKHKDVKDNWNNGLIHYASWAGHMDALIWFKNNYPKQFVEKNYYGRKPIHYAAWSGCTEALTWFKNNYPEQFVETDRDGEKPIHYAAWSGCTDALTWFKDNYSKQLVEKNDKKIDIPSCAAFSDSTQQLEIALLLSQNPNQFSFFTDTAVRFQESTITILLRLLETNYLITKVTNLEVVDQERRELIQFFLDRNKAIKDTKMRFLPFMQQLAHWLPPELKMLILKHLLPPDVDVDRVYHSLLPCNRALFILKDTLRESWALEQECIALSKLIDKLDRIQNLDKKTILKHLESWGKTFKPSQTNQFFKAKIPDNQLKCITLIKTILTKEEHCQNSNFPRLELLNGDRDNTYHPNILRQLR